MPHFPESDVNVGRIAPGNIFHIGQGVLHSHKYVPRIRWVTPDPQVRTLLDLWKTAKGRHLLKLWRAEREAAP